MKTFDFGKYKGQSVDSVIVSNPRYVQWCLKNCQFFYLEDEQHDRLRKELEKVSKIETARFNRWYGSDPNDDEDTEFDMDMKSCFDPNY